MTLSSTDLKTILEVWAPNHVFTGLALGFLIAGRPVQVLKFLPNKYFYRYHIYKILCYTFIWETIEHYLEEGMLGEAIQDWLLGVEYWGNRLITDPIIVAIGYVLIQFYPKTIIPARFLGFSWLFVHIIVFPHSLYLQHYLG